MIKLKAKPVGWTELGSTSPDHPDLSPDAASVSPEHLPGDGKGYWVFALDSPLNPAAFHATSFSGIPPARQLGAA
jgi:hypothetical protein